MLSYKDAGVSLVNAERIVDDIGNICRENRNHTELLSNFGLFSSSIDLKGYKEPVMVSSCDGVGTKLKLLKQFNMLDTAGWDLVAMNVNDIITSGANPVMFMDYIGVNKIERKTIGKLIKGIVAACNESGCVLAGGETAEMPDMVAHSLIELAGFCVGIAEKKNMIDIKKISAGDIAIGFESNGLHSNGFSLIRKIIEENAGYFNKEEMKRVLNKTRIYCKEIKKIKELGANIKGLAHITGGGIEGNLSRIIPDNLGVKITPPNIKDEIFNKILKYVNKSEAYRVFNMGIGMIAICDCKSAEIILNEFPDTFYLGEISKEKIKKVEVIL